MPVRTARPALALILLIAAIQALAGTARAGAWPQPKGSAFVTSALRVSAPGWAGPFHDYSTLYSEFGLGRRYTAGFDIGHSISGKGKAIIYLRRSFPAAHGGHVFAAELGVGRIAGETTLRPGLLYGKPIHWRGRQTGWLSIETLAELKPASRRTDIKADITFGINHGERAKTILQLQTGVSQGDLPFARAAPSVVFRLGQKSHIELGVTTGLVRDDHYGVKLGFWRSF